MAVYGLSKSFIQIATFGSKLTHCQSLAVSQGRWRSPKVGHGEVDFKSIPATQSSAVFQGRYLSLQKFHSCFHMVLHSF